MRIGNPEKSAALYSFVFVCSGNTCRSPVAEAFARDWVCRNLPDSVNRFSFASGGITALEGCAASPNAIEAAHYFDLNLNAHVSRRFTAELCMGATALTMTQSQLAVARRVARFSRCQTLSEWAGYPACDIADPFMSSLDEYIKCFRQIRDFVEAGLKRMIRL